MKIHFFGLTITLTERAIIAFTALAIGFMLLVDTTDLYSDYNMGLGLIFAFLSGVVGVVFVEVEGDII